MSTELKGRVIGARFKTYSGAAKRAQAERFYSKTHTFIVEAETDPFRRANGISWRIRKTKIVETRR